MIVNTVEYHGVLWQNDATHTPIDLGTLPGDTASTAAANTAGQVVGASWSNAAGQRAFLWQRGEMTELASFVDPLDGFWTIESVFGINNAGQIVGIGSSNGRGTAFS
jgi:probable HAF family extracellular repeat protein